MHSEDRTAPDGAPMLAPEGALPGGVLIIEPDSDVGRMLDVRLSREGYDILLAETGQGGVYLANQHLIDVVLLDRNLPDASNLDLLRQLRSTPNPCEVIVMTVDPTVEIFVEALDAGAFDLVIKPFSNLKLVTAKVANAIAKVRAERARDELAARLSVLAERDRVPGAAWAPGVFDGIDPVTGLPNRKAAEARFTQETTRALRYGRPLSVVYLLVDKLDKVIDVGDNAFAEHVLAEIARVIRRQIRSVDILARRDGAEFMLLLPETVKEAARVVAERLRATLSEATILETENASPESTLRVTASFGLAELPTDTMNADLLRQAAESALAQAAATGNMVVSYEPG